MKRKHRRMILAGVALAGLAAGGGLVLAALGDNLTYFRTPDDILTDAPEVGRAFRLGGLVEDGSLEMRPDGLTFRFRVVDGAHGIPVEFTGILPDLFREGQGIIAEGALTADGTFMADTVLAKHDENYMSPEVAEALERTGHPSAKQTTGDGS
ncbi:MAG: cytochrome c maturation protein CcmE [Pseudomonadota bacterium]